MPETSTRWLSSAPDISTSNGTNLAGGNGAVPSFCTCDSDTVGAYALSEAASGSDAFALETRAVRRGDDWVLNGQKLWITNGKEAGLFLVFATVDPAAGYKGVTAFLVPMDTPGVRLVRRPTSRMLCRLSLVFPGTKSTDGCLTVDRQDVQRRRR